MPCDIDAPFPFGVVRDLLGVTRAFYRAERQSGSPSRLARLEEAGKAYRLALDLARKGGPGSLGRRAARGWAENATALLGEVVQDQSDLAAVVQVSAVALGRRT